MESKYPAYVFSAQFATHTTMGVQPESIFRQLTVEITRIHGLRESERSPARVEAQMSHWSCILQVEPDSHQKEQQQRRRLVQWVGCCFLLNKNRKQSRRCPCSISQSIRQHRWLLRLLRESTFFSLFVCRTDPDNPYSSAYTKLIIWKGADSWINFFFLPPPLFSH